MKINEFIRYLDDNGLVVPATNDKIFKSLFMDKSMRDNLAFTISEVTKIDKEFLLKNMKLKNSFIPSNNYVEKENTTDLLIDIRGNAISLEMNSTNSNDTHFRKSLHYHALITNNIIQNDNYYTVKSVTQINFDNQIFDKASKDDLVSEYMVLNTKTYAIDKSEENNKKYHVNLALVRE